MQERGYIYLIPECTSTTDVHIVFILDAHTVLVETSLQNVQTCNVVKFSDERQLSKILVYPMNESELLSNKPSYINLWETERKEEGNTCGGIVSTLYLSPSASVTTPILLFLQIYNWMILVSVLTVGMSVH